MGSLSAKAEDIGEAILVIAIVVGGIAVPIFLNVSTTGMSTSQALAWGSVLTLVFAGLALGALRTMRGGKKK